MGLNLCTQYNHIIQPATEYNNDDDDDDDLYVAAECRYYTVLNCSLYADPPAMHCRPMCELPTR